jgi:sugar phosphate isomerase/epimerase
LQAGNRLALAYLTVDMGAPVDQIEAASAAGFDAVGLRLLAPHGLQLAHEIVGNNAQIRAIRRACENTGVEIFDVDVFTFAATTDMAALYRALETAAEIGASIIQTVCEDPDVQRARARFASFCAAAAVHGMSVAMEFMRWRQVSTIEEALAFVVQAGCPNGAICVDTLHLSRSGGTPASIATVPAERMPYVQLCDARVKIPPLQDMLQEARHDRLYPGEGELGLDDILDAMPLGIPISIEVPRIIHAHRSVRDRAKLAGDALRLYLAQYRDRASHISIGSESVHHR